MTAKKLLSGLVMLAIIGSMVGILIVPDRYPVHEQILQGIAAVAVTWAMVRAMLWAAAAMEGES